ncbi:MAG TPA: STN domain-containing protein [Puia sp.]|nr:STN domain-containing protein [Puia sp.]
MRRVTRGLGVAMLVLLWANRPLTLHAQGDKILNKKVMLHADHERLEDVLNDLAKSGYFTFSYQSDILKKDRLVTLTIKESTLREALELILGKAYDYLESDDYVVIRRRDAVAMKLRDGDVVAMKEKDGDVVAIKEKDGYVKPKMEMMKRAQMMKKASTMKKATRYVSDSLNTRDSLNMAAVRQTARNIIGDMIADGIIRDKGGFTYFALDNGQFVVDGRQMADSLRIRYAKKYVGPDGNGYYCGSVSGVTGRGYFLDKKEIFGEPKE